MNLEFFIRGILFVLNPGGDAGIRALNAELTLAGLFDQLAFVPDSNRKILHQINGMGFLPFISSTQLTSPVDEACPAAQSGQLK